MQKNVYFPDPPNAEYKRIERAAKKAGESVSEYLRKAALERIEREAK